MLVQWMNSHLLLGSLEFGPLRFSSRGSIDSSARNDAAVGQCDQEDIVLGKFSMPRLGWSGQTGETDRLRRTAGSGCRTRNAVGRRQAWSGRCRQECKEDVGRRQALARSANKKHASWWEKADSNVRCKKSSEPS
jgi:hypothetical protein